MRSRAVGGRGAYAGIGSRDTPDAMLALIETIAASLARAGWVLRTGLSPGADQAFYRATVAAGGTVELYLPWPGFGARARVERERENVREQSQPSPAAYELATHFYRAWHGAEWAELA